MPRELRRRELCEPMPHRFHKPRCEPSHAEILEYLEDISERLAKIEESMERH